MPSSTWAKACLSFLGVAAAESSTAESYRTASFLVLGDWGWDPKTHGNLKSRHCQEVIAQRMDQEMGTLGDVKFVINVGDSFYPNGVAHKWDEQWNSKWRYVYSQQVRSVPWYSVYGNHDMILDPGTCSSDEGASAQINYDKSNLDFFYMPGFSYSIVDSDLDLEILGLDLNELWEGYTCPWSQCEHACRANVQARKAAALELFHERMNQSNASNMIVFSHYPTDYLWAHADVLDKMSNGTRPAGHARHVEYFAGHRHNVDQHSTTSIHPNNNWLVGGGGGWGCDGHEQGFVVGELFSDGTMTSRSVIVDYADCCR